MFGSIRRVISEAEDLGTGSASAASAASAAEQQQQQVVGTPQKECYTNDDSAMSAAQLQQSPGEGEEAAAASALIEPEGGGGGGDPMQVETNDNNNNNNNNNNSMDSSSHHAPLMLVHSSNHSGSSSSSLSDASGAGDEEEDEDDNAPPEDDDNNNNNINLQQQQQQPQQQQTFLQPTTSNTNFNIMNNNNNNTIGSGMNGLNDSSSDAGSGSQCAKASQTSRDWGWFEDVHCQSSEGLLFGGSSSLHKNKSINKHNMLMDSAITASLLHHQEDNDAAAMAVTAPTYVLEESLSSQKLWKDTAGNRPPQPLEERAFFEKMWAQNFALSQVNYSVPVEVLTASSPISLNPFADGLGLEDVGAGTGCGGHHGGAAHHGAELSSYNIPVGAVLTSGGAHHYQAQSHHKGPGDAAEAALVSRMTEESTAAGTAGTLVNQRVRGTGSDGDLTVLLRGPNAFGTTVSKSFARPSRNGGPIAGVDTVNISIASYRVVESKKYGKYAQFLVIYREGSIRDTIGIWKRYRDFEELAHKVTQAHDGCTAVIANMAPLQTVGAAKTSFRGGGGGVDNTETEHLPNAVTSWCLLKKRKRWYRCLDAGYLSLKVFLLERFLHDILFESSSPQLLRDFVLGPQQHSHHSD